MSRYRYHLFVCTNDRPAGHPRGSCLKKGSESFIEIVKEEAGKARIPGPWRSNRSGCLDACEEGPVMAIYPDGIYYRIQSREDIARIMQTHLIEGRIVTDLQIPNPPQASAPPPAKLP